MYTFCSILLFLSSSFINKVYSKNVGCQASVSAFVPAGNALISINHEIRTFATSEDFIDATCAQCYYFMGSSSVHWKNDSIVNEEMVLYINSKPTQSVGMIFKNKMTNNTSFQLFKYNKLKTNDKENDYFLKEFINDYHMNIFTKCCSDAKYCCEDIQLSKNWPTSNRCLAQWDGWSCWHSAETDTTQYNKCPDMCYSELDEMPSECARDYASKECTSNGTWFTQLKNISGKLQPKEYNDYDQCYRLGVAQKKKESYLYIAGYSISLLFTLLGSLIFLVYKQYKLLRIRIHLNFFLALMLSCIFSIVFFANQNINQTNQITCKTMTVLHKSVHLANYCWMLIEGFYLHQLITTMAAIREKRSAFYLYIFGWGTTPLIMVVYICLHSMQKYDDSCWAHMQTAPDIIWETVPLFCFVANLLLLANIIRVLYTKLRSTPDHLLSGLKASLALIPVYGVHFLFYAFPYDPYKSCSGGLFLLRYSQILITSLQGVMISAIFCFFNREVHMNIKRTIRRRFPKKDTTEMVTEEATV